VAIQAERSPLKSSTNPVGPAITPPLPNVDASSAIVVTQTVRLCLAITFISKMSRLLVPNLPVEASTRAAHAKNSAELIAGCETHSGVKRLRPFLAGRSNIVAVRGLTDCQATRLLTFKLLDE
jgi:hypothetical protein